MNPRSMTTNEDIKTRLLENWTQAMQNPAIDGSVREHIERVLGDEYRMRMDYTAITTITDAGPDTDADHDQAQVA